MKGKKKTMRLIPEKYWHKTFVITICIKCLTGITETVSGILLLFIQPTTLAHILARFSRSEQLEDPQDFFLDFAYQYIHRLNTSTKDFAGLYILAHGLINLFLVLGLIREKAWAYLIAIGVLGSFMLYQVFRIAMHPFSSPLLVVLTIFDTFFIVLIIHEYRYLTRKLAKR